ncbi:MAG TPA: flippase [Solirubrobacteraceae bacterium]
MRLARKGCAATKAALPPQQPAWRRLLHGGASGDAATAGGRAIASNIAAQMLARAISMATGLVTVALTARTLGSSGFGVLTGMAAYVSLYTVLTELGLTNIAIQRMTADPEREAEWLGALVGLRMILSLIATAVCAVSIPLLLTNAHDGHAVGLITAIMILLTGPQALAIVFQARLRAGLTMIFSLTQSLVWLGLVTALAIVHGSVVAFAAANVVAVAAQTLLQVQATRRFAHVAWRRGRALWKPLMAVALPLGLALVLITVYYQIDSVLLLQIAGPRETGIYNAAYKFLNPLIAIPGLTMISFFPVMSAVKAHDPERVARLVQICFDLMAVVSLPFLAVTIALAHPIIHLVYGPRYHGAASLLPILMIAFVAICYGNVSGFLAPLMQLQWRLALYSAIGMAANVVLNLLLIPSHGAHGSAWATAVTETLTMLLMMGTSLRVLKIRIAVGKVLRTLLLAAAMTGLMALAAPLGLVPAGVLGLILYAVGLFALRIVRVDDLGSLRKGRAINV